MLKLLKDWSLRVWYRRRVVGRGGEHVRRVLGQGQGAQHGLWLSGTQSYKLYPYCYSFHYFMSKK